MRGAKRKRRPSPAKIKAQSEQQSPEAAPQTENDTQKQKQGASVDKDWLPAVVILLPVVISLGTFAAGIFFQHRYLLSMLITFLTIVIFLWLTYVALRGLRALEPYRWLVRLCASAIGVAALAMLLAVTSDEWGGPNTAPPQPADTGISERHASSPPAPSEVFTIRKLNFIMLPTYPQPLLYAYSRASFISDAPAERYVAPVGLALNVEVVNDRATATKVQSYSVELEDDAGGWTRINRLPMTEPRNVYFAEGDGLKECFKFDFKSNIFDVVARQKNLAPGESIDGWMFFEWPPELRENSRLRNIRVRMENSQGETEEAVFKILRDDDEAEGDPIDSGAFGVKDQHIRAKDLSGLSVRPFSGE